MYRMLAVVLLGLFLLAGCAGHVSQAQLDAADYGELSPNYKEAIKEHMQTQFYDPESARYRMVRPTRIYG